MKKIMVVVMALFLAGCMEQIRDGEEMTVAVKKEISSGVFNYYLDVPGDFIRTTCTSKESLEEGDIVTIKYIKKVSKGD